MVALVRAPLRNRPFRLLFAAQCASLLGDAVFLVALAFAVLEVANSPAALGGVLAAGSIVMVATLVVSGVWADRLPRFRLMVGSDLVCALSQALLAFLLLSGQASLAAVMALHCCFMAAAAFFQPALSGVVPQLLPAEQLLTGNGLLVSARSATAVAGAALGGVLVAALGPATAIALDALTFLLSALLLLLAQRASGALAPPSRASAPAPAAGSFRQELHAGWASAPSAPLAVADDTRRRPVRAHL